MLVPPLARRQVGLEVLGVVENMSGLQQRVAGLRFYSTPTANIGAAASEPVDVTEAALAALAAVAPDLVVHSDVFVPTKGGAAAMAADMGVPFLGRVPLDPALSLAGAALPMLCMLRLLDATAAAPGPRAQPGRCCLFACYMQVLLRCCMMRPLCCQRLVFCEVHACMI
jgi:hypothetical protein